MKFAFVFTVSAGLLFLLLWLYPAHIFDSVVSGQGQELEIQLSLKSIFLNKDFPEAVNAANVESAKPTFAGYAMMVICLIGLPAMVAWRFNLKRSRKDSSG